MEERNIYRDIATRTKGDIYIGEEDMIGINRVRIALFGLSQQNALINKRFSGFDSKNHSLEISPINFKNIVKIRECGKPTFPYFNF